MNCKKNIIITGGASGIGFETSKLFIKNGFNVHVLDKKSPIEKDHLINYYLCDVSSSSQVSKVINTIAQKENGVISSLFINAGKYFKGNIEETTEEIFYEVLNTNISGMYNVIKHALKYMKKNGGSIVITGSDQSFIGKQNCFAYGLTKGALAQASKSLSLDYAKYEIRVNCICPGAIETPLYKNAVKEESLSNKNLSTIEVEERIKHDYPLGRIGKSSEVSELVYFLAVASQRKRLSSSSSI